jgi:hypothetical protein
MTVLMVNKSLAGQEWKTSRRPASRAPFVTYKVDEYGMIGADERDVEEAGKAGFAAYDPGDRVKMKAPDDETRDSYEGDIFTAEKTGHQYALSDKGIIDIFEDDVDEAKAAGFTEVKS